MGGDLVRVDAADDGDVRHRRCPESFDALVREHRDEVVEGRHRGPRRRRRGEPLEDAGQVVVGAVAVDDLVVELVRHHQRDVLPEHALEIGLAHRRDVLQREVQARADALGRRRSDRPGGLHLGHVRALGHGVGGVHSGGDRGRRVGAGLDQRHVDGQLVGDARGEHLGAQDVEIDSRGPRRRGHRPHLQPSRPLLRGRLPQLERDAGHAGGLRQLALGAVRIAPAVRGVEVARQPCSGAQFEPLAGLGVVGAGHAGLDFALGVLRIDGHACRPQLPFGVGGPRLDAVELGALVVGEVVDAGQLDGLLAVLGLAVQELAESFL